MLKDLRNVLWRGKSDFSIEELRWQKEISSYMYLFALAFAVMYALSVAQFVGYVEVWLTVALIFGMILIGIGACVFAKREQLCNIWIERKEKEKKTVEIVKCIKDGETKKVKIVNEELKQRRAFVTIFLKKYNIIIRQRGYRDIVICVSSQKLLEYFDI